MNGTKSCIAISHITDDDSNCDQVVNLVKGPEMCIRDRTEAGSSASATVAPQGELGDNKYLQAELQGGKVHLPVIVFEDPKVCLLYTSSIV